MLPNSILCCAMRYSLLFALCFFIQFNTLSAQVPTHDCESAPTLCSPQDLNGVTGVTPGELPDVGTHCGGSAITGPDWYCFLGNGNVVTIQINIGTCTLGQGVEAGLYEACTRTGDCFAFPCTGACPPLIWPTVPGQKYCVMIDGWGDDSCNYTLIVTGGGPNALTTDLMETTACAGEDLCFTASSNHSSFPTITWTVDGIIVSTGEKIVYTVPDGTPDGTVLRVCVSEDACLTEICHNITVYSTPDIDLGLIDVCEGECYTTPLGNLACNQGINEFDLTDAYGCTYKEVVDLNILPTTTVDRFEIYVCNTFDVAQIKKPPGGVPEPPFFATFGSNKHTWMDANECDYCMEGELKLFEVNLAIDEYCENQEFVLTLEIDWDDPLVTINNIMWTRDALPIPEMGKSINVSEKGLYCVNLSYTITNNYLGQIFDYPCTKEICTPIGVQLPLPNIIGDTVICEGQDLSISTEANGIEQYNWIVENGKIVLDSLNPGQDIEVRFNPGATTGKIKLIVKDECGNVSDTSCFEVTIIPAEIVDAGQDTSVCDLIIDLCASTANGMWSVTDRPVASNINFQDNVNPKSSVDVDIYGLYTFQWVSGVGTECSDSASVIIDFYEAPDSIDFREQCIGEDSVLIVFNILSGRGPFTITQGSGNILQDPMTGIYTFQSNLIEQNTNYTITVEDKNGCSFTLNGIKECDCNNEPGDMSLDTIKFCGAQNIDASPYYLGGHQKANGDTLIYILHEGNSNILINPTQSSFTGQFTFSGGMMYNRLYYISLVVGPLDVNGNLDQNAACLQVSEGLPVIWYEEVNADAGADTSLCGLSQISLTRSSNPYGSHWQVIDDPAHTTVFIDNDSVITFEVDLVGTYTLYRHVVNGICHDSDLVSITFFDEPELMSPIAYDCFFNSTDTTYAAEFTISGGIPPYIIVSGGGNIVGNAYTSDVLMTGTTRTIVIEDQNGCSLTLDVNFNCSCSKASGDMDPTALTLCGEGCLTGNSISNPTLEAGDTVLFALHDGSSILLGNIIQSNTTPDFCFDGLTMALDQTYFISMIVGQQSGLSEIDPLLDPCFIYGLGQPITFYSFPTILTNPTDTITCLQGSIDLDASASDGGGLGGYTIAWTDLAGSNADIQQADTYTPSVLKGGQFIVTLTNDATGCTSKDTITVNTNLNKPTAQVDFNAEDYISCRNDSVIVTANSSSTNETEWLDDQGQLISPMSSLTINDAGDYFLVVTDPNNGCKDTIPFSVKEIANTLQDIQAELINPDCFDARSGSINIQGIIGGHGLYRFSVNNGPFSSSTTIDGLGQGQYIIQVMDSLGCTYNDTFNLVAPGLPSANVVDTVLLSKGEKLALDDIILGTTNVDSLIHKHDQNNQILIDTIIGDQNFIIRTTFYSEDGCLITELTYVIIEIPVINVFVPNVFSPDGNGLNDYFGVFTNEEVSLINQIHVYDRWGEKVYIGLDLLPGERGWDGRFREEDATPGVYVYHIIVTLLDGSTQSFSGDLTLIR